MANQLRAAGSSPINRHGCMSAQPCPHKIKPVLKLFGIANKSARANSLKTAVRLHCNIGFHNGEALSVTKASTVFCILILFQLGSSAQSLPLLPAPLNNLQPQNVFPANASSSFIFSDQTTNGKPAFFGVDSTNSAAPVFTAEVFSAPKSHFNIQSAWNTIAAIKRGDVLLARMVVRSIYAKQESGDAVLNFFVQQSVAPFDRASAD